jgi:hypothetical protein
MKRHHKLIEDDLRQFGRVPLAVSNRSVYV